jgi:hypothetical protein
VFLNPKKKVIMKKFLLGVMMAASIAGTAQASVKSNQDMDMLFNAAPVTAQVEQLSTQEMKATQGEFYWWAPNVVGAGVGAFSYGLSCSTCTLGGYVVSAGWGAANPISSYYSFARNVGFGVGWGLGSRYGWW